MIDPRLQLIDSGRRDQATISEKMFKPVDRIAFLPILEKFRRYISGIIVSRMTRHAECFAFDQSRTLPGTRTFDRAGCRFPNSQNVVAIHNLAGQTICFGTIRNIFDGHLAFQRRGVGVLIVITDEDNRHLPNRRDVDTLVPIAAAGCSVAKEAKDDAVLAAHLHRKADPGRNRNVVTKHADKGDQIFRQIAHVHVAFFAARGTGLTRHILRKDGAQRHSTNEESSHVAMRWTNHVVLPQVDAATYRDRFLTAPDVYTTDNFSLTIKFPLDPELEFARELHVIQHVEEGLFSRKSDRRYGIPGERLRVRRIHLHWDLQNRRYSKDVSFFNSASCSGTTSKSNSRKGN